MNRTTRSCGTRLTGGRLTGGLRGLSGSSTRFSVATSPTHSTIYLAPFIATPLAPISGRLQKIEDRTTTMQALLKELSDTSKKIQVQFCY